MMGTVLLSSLLILSMIGVQNAPGSTVVFQSEPLTISDTSKDSTFNCHHPAAGNTNFKVVLSNGTIVTRGTNSGIIYNTCFQNGLRYTVTIPSQPEYFGARVHCLIVSDAQLESPPTFTLTTTSLRTKNISVEEIATFECASCGRIDWLVNGTDLNNLQVTNNDIINVTLSPPADANTRISTLFIVGRSVYNGISIECRADGVEQYLPPVKLFVYTRPCPENLSLNSHVMVNSEKLVEVILKAHLNNSISRVSDMSTVKLDSLDGLNSTQLQAVPSSYHDQTLTLTLTLAHRRIWNAIVVDYCLTFELSTHDIQNISVSSTHPGQVSVTSDFIQGSTATAILTILYREEDSYVIYDLVSRKEDETVTDISGVGNGNYEAFVFDVEGNGTYSSATVKPIMVNVMLSDSDETPPSPRIEYEVQNTSTGFRVTCTFLDHHITECVVVVHRKFPLRHSHLSVTLYHFRLGSVGNMISGYIYVANPDDIQIAVVGGTKKIRRTTSSTPSWVIAVIVSFCSLVLAGSVIIAAKCVHKSWMKQQEAREEDSESQHLSQSAVAGPAELNREEPSHTDLSFQDEPLIPEATVPEEESDKEVEHRTNGPLPSRRRNQGEGDGGDRSDNMQPQIGIFFGIMRISSQNSEELQGQHNQYSQEEEDENSTPVDNQVGIPGSIDHLYDSELDDDTKSEVEFSLSIDATEQISTSETKL